MATKAAKRHGKARAAGAKRPGGKRRAKGHKTAPKRGGIRH